MIKIILYKDKEGLIRKFQVSGHSGFAPEGEDIICSAISALSQTTIGALTELTDLEIEYNIDEREPFLECQISQSDSSKDDDKKTANIILKTFSIGCRQILQSYDKKYIGIEESEY